MNSTRQMGLRLLSGSFAVARLAPDADEPSWIAGEVTCVARTPTELSVLCADDVVPESVRSTGPWRCLEVEGPLDFAEIGILSALTAALADAGVSVFAFSTFDTDYLLVRSERLGAALEALERAGHRVAQPEAQ